MCDHAAAAELNLVPLTSSILLQISILVLALGTLGFTWWAKRTGSPLLAVASRWCRWFFTGAIGGYLLSETGWTNYPFWVTASVSFLGWFLVETIYNWVVISAISRSDLPFFPRFELNERTGQWPKDDRSIQLRDWLRSSGFKKHQSLLARMDDQILMHVFVYENPQNHVRAHILFFGGIGMNNAVSFAFNSLDVRERRWVTDNLFLPYGGFYPEDWSVERHPLMQSAEKLYQRHLERMDAALSDAWLPFKQDSIEVLNADRVALEKLNREMGFFNSEEDIENKGRISPAGRHRIWQELWTISYFGRARRYS